MPAPRKSSARKPAARKPPARKPAARRSTKSASASPAKKRTSSTPSATTPAQDSLREQLQRVLNPLEALVITRERLQDTLDDAVRRGRMTRDDASDLLSELVRRGRRQTEDLLSDLEGVIGGTRKRVEAPTDRMLREVDRARRAAGIGPSFPIMGYDDLTAAQVTERLSDLSAPELRKVRDYERRNANRKSVLAATEQKLK